jgi:nitroimidazol reductase NimA-like FMN-containing flavoprotein (pyridoxamine 5'-phosphate oxidase superfamily)
MTETVAPVSLLSATESWDLLRSNAFARLALSVGDQPEIFPINYAVQGGTLLFRTSQGTKLAALTINASVALEIDGYDGVGGWSVVVKGEAHEAEWGDDYDEAGVSGLRPWVATRKPVFVRITPAQITGRTFVFGPEPDDL